MEGPVMETTVATLVKAPTVIPLSGIILPGLEVPISKQVEMGCYDRTVAAINDQQCALTLPAGPRELALVDFNGEYVNTSTVNNWVTSNEYESGLIDDLLAVGAHPEYRILQTRFPIIALNAFVGSKRVAYLDTEKNLRCLYITWGGGAWDVRACFLVHRISSSQAI
jgi:hypothetical protein